MATTPGIEPYGEDAGTIYQQQYRHDGQHRVSVADVTAKPNEGESKRRKGTYGYTGSGSDTTLQHANQPSWEATREKQPPPADTEHQAENIFSQGDQNYRTVGRWMSGIILITNQVGIGILSLPGALQTLGIVPGVIAIVGLGLLSTYTAYELLQFYRRYPHVVNVADMARIVGGPVLEVIVAISLLIKICLTCASATVTISIALNSLSNHGLCTVGFTGIAVIGFWLLCLPRTFSFVAKVGIPSTISIVAAVLIVMISLGVGDPQGAPENFTLEVNIVGNPSFLEGLTACLNICYAYAGNIGFVTYMAEMRNPSKDFMPALVILQCFSIPFYIIVAVTIYCLAGQYTTSPSLGSAPPLPAKIAYGVVIPCLLATGLVFGHTAIKYLFVASMRALKATDQMTSNSAKSWIVWVFCTTAFWICAFILANAIPIFDSILSISSATFIAWFTFGISSVFFFHLNWHQLFATWQKKALTVLNILIIVMSLFMNSAGLWAAVKGLLQNFDNEENSIRGPFTCADNGIL